MLDKKSDVAAEIGSRICHDLISPIGAISNGMELLELTGAAQSPEMQLIAESVKSANAKIRFLRVAFGDATGGGSIGTSEIKDILGHNYSDNRLKIAWHVTVPLERQDVKLCFLILMCLENTLPYGGTITVADKADGWQFDIEGQQIKTSDVIDMNAQRFCALTGPASVQYRLVDHIVSDCGYTLSFTQNAQGLSVTLTP